MPSVVQEADRGAALGPVLASELAIPGDTLTRILDSLTGYPGLFVWCALSGILIPIPEDVPQVYAGMRVASGELGYAAVPVAFAGVLLRDGLVFGVGHLLGERALSSPWVNRVLPRRKIEAARARIAAHGPAAVLIARLSIGVRSGTFFTAGALGVRPRDFLVWDLAGLLVTVPLLTGLGYVFGEPIAAGLLWLAARAQWVVPIAGALIAAGWGGGRGAPPPPPADT